MKPVTCLKISIVDRCSSALIQLGADKLPVMLLKADINNPSTMDVCAHLAIAVWLIMLIEW